jgi:hypothetical protein
MDKASQGNEPKNDARERFLRAYANLPVGVRQEIVAVIEEGPVTWQVAYFEVKNDTEKGKQILEQLKQLHII